MTEMSKKMGPAFRTVTEEDTAAAVAEMEETIQQLPTLEEGEATIQGKQEIEDDLLIFADVLHRRREQVGRPMENEEEKLTAMGNVYQEVCTLAGSMNASTDELLNWLKDVRREERRRQRAKGKEMRRRARHASALVEQARRRQQ